MRDNRNSCKELKKFAEDFNRCEKAEKDIVSNYNYISWLEAFTSKYETFADDRLISAEDLGNSKKLSDLFGAIYSYCDKFHIVVGEMFDLYEHLYVHIEHNGIGYQIGRVSGNSGCYYVKREPVKEDSIKFANIVDDIYPENPFYEKKEKVDDESEISDAYDGMIFSIPKK